MEAMLIRNRDGRGLKEYDSEIEMEITLDPEIIDQESLSWLERVRIVGLNGTLLSSLVSAPVMTAASSLPGSGATILTSPQRSSLATRRARHRSSE